jgi:hypothetical protein
MSSFLNSIKYNSIKRHLKSERNLDQCVLDITKIFDKGLREAKYLFVTKNVARPESLSILSMGTIAVSSLIYLVGNFTKTKK